MVGDQVLKLWEEIEFGVWLATVGHMNVDENSVGLISLFHCSRNNTN